MARQNSIFLLGCVAKMKNNPVVQKNDAGEPIYVMVYIEVVRGKRKVGDFKHNLKGDRILIMSRDEKIMEEIMNWKTLDIVEIKGAITSKNIKKSSFCPECGSKNGAIGSLVYVNPIFAKCRYRLESEEQVRNFMEENQEISNQAFILGTLCQNPKKVMPKEGLIVTQYPLALNRKFRIKTDPPETRTDYPWVKSYGDNAVEDRKRLHTGSEVFVDGCLQMRKIQRHIACETCGQNYDWKDNALEIVPYDTEYIGDFYSDEEIEENERQRAEQIKQSIIKNEGSETYDTYTEEEIAAGIDSQEF